MSTKTIDFDFLGPPITNPLEQREGVEFLREVDATPIQQEERIKKIRTIVANFSSNKECNLECRKTFFQFVVKWPLFEALDEETKKTILIARRELGLDAPFPISVSPRTTWAIQRIKHLVNIFSHRPLKNMHFHTPGGLETLLGVNRTDVAHELDKTLFEEILDVHNKCFQHELDIFTKCPDAEGRIDFLEVEEDSPLLIRADLHGDLTTLQALLDFMITSNLCNSDYCFRPQFHFICLGDFLDRGPNEIETISLLLLLRLINPHNVHLIRGNHEDIEINREHSHEKAWIEANKEPLTRCYQTLATVLLVAEKKGRIDKKNRKEYLSCSHGALSTLIDPFEHPEKLHVIIRKDPPSSPRIMDLCFSQRGKKYEKAVEWIIKAQILERQVQSMDEDDTGRKSTPFDSYTWSDIDTESEDVYIGRSGRGRGLIMTVEVLHALFRCGTEQACIKALIKGHSHSFEEGKDSKSKGDGKKVLVTILPAAPAGGVYMDSGQPRQPQALLLTVCNRMKTWKKQPLFLMDKNRLVLGKIFDMYDGFGS